jgi:hypothetical protein
MMALYDLNSIRVKIRKLTRSPSPAQISDTDLDNYINTFVLYDFPEILRLFSLRTTFTFYTKAGVDVYATNTTDPNDPFYNFQNLYIAVHPDSVFIAGIPAGYTQWRNVFYGQWPQTNQVQNTYVTGNGSEGPFTGILNTFPQFANTPIGSNTGSILQNSMIFSCLDINHNTMVLIDYPSTIDPTIGYLSLPNSVPAPTSAIPYGQINYQTGAYTVTFPVDTLDSVNNPIWSEFVPYIAGLPISLLYYNNEFTVRPVPDKAYSVQIEADMRPSEILQSPNSPPIEQWWQTIAYGAALKIFQDRMDIDSANLIWPEFRRQLNMSNRTSITQYANERTNTIYTTGKSYGWGWYNSNFPF